MASPYPLRAYWLSNPPDLADLGPRLLNADASGALGLDLPNGARLWHAFAEANCHAFAMSGAVQDDDGAATQIEAFLRGCLAEGAVAAWSGAFREDDIWDALGQIDDAMAALSEGAVLPLSLIAEPGAALCLWDARFASDLAATETVAGVSLWRASAPIRSSA